jgi:hypothetical protein
VRGACPKAKTYAATERDGNVELRL